MTAPSEQRPTPTKRGELAGEIKTFAIGVYLGAGLTFGALVMIAALHWAGKLISWATS